MERKHKGVYNQGGIVGVQHMTGTEAMCIILTVINCIATALSNRQHLKAVDAMVALQGKFGHGGVSFKDIGGDVSIDGDMAGRDADINDR